jgi:hypothetical protein
LRQLNSLHIEGFWLIPNADIDTLENVFQRDRRPD